MTRLALVVTALLGAAGTAHAQMCAGNASFREGTFQLGGATSFTEGAQGVGGTFAGGGNWFFAGAGVSLVHDSTLDSRATNINAFAGIEAPIDRRNRVFLCPVGEVTFGAGPDSDSIEVSTFGLRGGGSLGVVAAERGRLLVVPTLSLSALYQRAALEFQGTEETVTDTGGLASVGVGLLFNRRIGLTPSVAVPFSVGSSDAIFTVRLTINFGD